MNHMEDHTQREGCAYKGIHCLVLESWIEGARLKRLKKAVLTGTTVSVLGGHLGNINDHLKLSVKGNML